MKVQKYQNLYSKMLYVNNAKPYGKGFKELQATKYPFHSGGCIKIVDGFNDTTIREWRNVKELIRLWRQLSKEITK